MNNDYLEDLYANNLIVIPRNLFHRKKQELAALEKLKCKQDFLSRYNVAIRYLFLYFLDKGYDIPNSKVHFVFKLFCIEILKTDKIEVNQIITCRHRMKYKNILPSLIVMENLDNVIDEIEFSNYQNKVFNA